MSEVRPPLFDTCHNPDTEQPPRKAKARKAKKPASEGLASTNLVPSETTDRGILEAEMRSRRPPDWPWYSWRHGSDWASRVRIYRAMEQVGLPGRRLERFRNCGINAYVQQAVTQPGTYRVVADHCRDRFCGACGRQRSRLIAVNVALVLRRKRVRMLTLTLKHCKQSLSSQIDKLVKSYSKLRQRKLWKANVTGAISFLEVEYSPGRDEWHPHLHVLIVGKYVPHDQLRKAWLAITHDSTIVHITMAKQQGDVARYACKYASKPLNHKAVCVPDRLREAIEALHGRRLIIKTGILTAVDLFAYDDGLEWVTLRPLSAYVRDARNGDKAAIEVLSNLRRAPSTGDETEVGRSPPELGDDDFDQDWPEYGPLLKWSDKERQ